MKMPSYSPIILGSRGVIVKAPWDVNKYWIRGRGDGVDGEEWISRRMTSGT
jgi:hypothetical protein